MGENFMTVSNSLDLTVVILTFNEEKHIRRCIESVQTVAHEIFIIDSYSTDKTLDICQGLGVIVYQHPFSSHAEQFNWGLRNCPIKTEWVMRLDADEYLLPDLAAEINSRLTLLPQSVAGVYLKRRVIFQERWIRYGGYYPVWLLRIWRNGKAFSEERLMDEHMKLVEGDAIRFDYDFVDENLHNLTSWTSKHNGYSTKEAIELLNMVYRFLDHETVEPKLLGTQEQRKRWLKVRYAQVPVFIRPVFYFIYRYFIKFGFMDGKKGIVWHFLQGFWYRFLVDAKFLELVTFMKQNHCDARLAVYQLHGIKLEKGD